MKIGIGSDHNGFEMKELLKDYISSLGYEIKDYGCFSKEDTDYPKVAFNVSKRILDSSIDRGILVCGTGIGMAIAANKIPGIRAAQCYDTYSAERSQLSNNAQIITLGSKIVGQEVAKKIVLEYLNNTFKGGNSERKIKQIMEAERK